MVVGILLALRSGVAEVVCIEDFPESLEIIWCLLVWCILECAAEIEDEEEQGRVLSENTLSSFRGYFLKKRNFSEQAPTHPPTHLQKVPWYFLIFATKTA